MLSPRTNIDLETITFKLVLKKETYTSTGNDWRKIHIFRIRRERDLEPPRFYMQYTLLCAICMLISLATHDSEFIYTTLCSDRTIQSKVTTVYIFRLGQGDFETPRFIFYLNAFPSDQY